VKPVFQPPLGCAAIPATPAIAHATAAIATILA
jgi:hypothetical protein